MEDTGYGNAMTEIALALAMAFFSIMVLTMISMGVGDAESKPAIGAVVAPAETDSAPAARIHAQREDQIVVYYGGTYFDKDLHPIDPAKLDDGGRVILALEPGLPMAEVLAARARIDVQDLVVSVLDDRWMARLKGIGK